MACRLIALYKCPGVRPIGICETVRRIIAKAVLFATKGDLKEAAGSQQPCAEQIAGIEAAVHAVRSLFSAEDTEAIILVDTSNVFNSINRQVVLRNARVLCPSLAKILINTYRAASDLYIEGQVVLSEEGTTQGDQLAMPLYALATIPLINNLNSTGEVKQVWYADDASDSGSLPSLREWWDKLGSISPAFGYLVNASKTWLITKENNLYKAKDIFQDSGVKITSKRRPYLGATIGSADFIGEFVTDKTNSWCKQLRLLADVANTQPHAAYTVFIHGFLHKFTYLCRTNEDIDHLLQPLEEVIRLRLILTSYPGPHITVFPLEAW